MFGQLENGERRATKEEAEKYIDELFDITPAAFLILMTHHPISCEDFEFCIKFANAAKNAAKKVVDRMEEKNGKKNNKNQ